MSRSSYRYDLAIRLKWLLAVLSFAVASSVFAQQPGEPPVNGNAAVAVASSEPAEADPGGEPTEPADNNVEREVSESEAAMPLPEWEAEERRAMLQGEMVPGFSLLGVTEFDLREEFSEMLGESSYADAQPKRDPREVPPEVMGQYQIGDRKLYLNDPQLLLTQQARMDIEHFLNLQAEESMFSIYLVLFDSEQMVPAGINLRSLMKRSYHKFDRSLVVMYHVGAPKRTQLSYTEDLAKVLGGQQREMTKRAISSALRQSDPQSQLHSLLVSLGNQLYWLEETAQVKLASRSEGDEAAIELTFNEDGSLDKGANELAAKEPNPLIEKLQGWLQTLGISLMFAAAGLAVVTALIGLIWLYFRYKRYSLPEIEVEERLAAPHAAGVGPVMKFANPNLAPTAQAGENVPDYLTRL